MLMALFQELWFIVSYLNCNPMANCVLSKLAITCNRDSLKLEQAQFHFLNKVTFKALLTMFSLLKIWAASPYMLSVSLVRCNIEALKKLHFKSTIKCFKDVKIDKWPDLSYSLFPVDCCVRINVKAWPFSQWWYSVIDILIMTA